MQICCTKKLLDETGIVPGPDNGEQDLFCWSAHLITVNRRRTIVIVNDSNRFGFVLHGLKVKDFKQLNEYILNGIKSSLKDEKIKREVIESYLQSAGDLIFTRTRGPKYVGRLNKACEMAEVFNDRLDRDAIFQSKASRIINSDLIKISKESDYRHPHEILIEDFIRFAGMDVISCAAVMINIELYLGSYSAVRRILTPADITFRQLHKILQIAYDWKNYHGYDFYIFNEGENPVLRLVSGMEECYDSEQQYKTLPDEDVKLQDYINGNFKISYRYDYGDNWEHRINIMNIIEDSDKNYPVCLEGDGNAPPEDVGGVPGYEEFLKIMADTSNEEYTETREWALNQWYKDFDIDLVNRRLVSVLR